VADNPSPERDVHERGREGRGALPTFLIGTAVGGVAGATAGILLGFNMRALVSALSRSVGRDRDGDEPRFEYLLQ